jgi:hypothetical protein
MRVHENENNLESQTNLDANKVKFSKQCLTVLELLRQGKRLTTLNAPTYGIRSLPRRIKDLRDLNGITDISDEWILNEKGHQVEKVWFINFKTERQQKENHYTGKQKSAGQIANDIISKTQQGNLFQA